MDTPKKRSVDICFASDEMLWRAVAKEDILKDGSVKPHRLRLQVSVARSSKGRRAMDAAIRPDAPPKFNGVVGVTAGIARSIRKDRVYVVCVDEPLKENEEHALIALISDGEPGTVPDTDVDQARAELAAHMKVALKPT